MEKTCKYITSDMVPDIYVTLSKVVSRGKYHGCFHLNEDRTFILFM